MDGMSSQSCEPTAAPIHSQADRGAELHPKILFLIDEMSSITAGGTERQLLQQVEIAKKSDLSPTVCVLRGTEWLTGRIAGCEVKHFEIERICSLDGLVKLRELVRWMRGERFHILQTFFSESNLIGPWIGRLAAIPVVLGTRRNLNHATNDGLNSFGIRLQAVSNMLVDRIIANSEAVLERVAESEMGSRRKLCVVYNGIDLSQMRIRAGDGVKLRRQLGLKEHHVLVGNISGLRRIKGVDIFVKAAAVASREHPQLRFVLVGDGELREEIEQLVEEYCLREVFIMAGAADDVSPFLAAMDVAVLSSMAEGFSNSLLEYMAAELPTIATDVGGNREALGGSGILIEAGKPGALASAIGSLVDGSVRKACSSGAYRAVQRFDVKIAEARMRELYWSHLRNIPGPYGLTSWQNVQTDSHREALSIAETPEGKNMHRDCGGSADQIPVSNVQ
jgi:glycosyltransferase involved in cell wall biosynthesis